MQTTSRARTIIFKPEDWPDQEIDISSAIGFNLRWQQRYYCSGSALSTNTASTVGDNNNSVDVISFNQSGQEVKRSTLSGEGLLSAEVRENLDSTTTV